MSHTPLVTTHPNPTNAKDGGDIINANFALHDTEIAAKLPLAGGIMTGDIIFNDNVSSVYGTDGDHSIKGDGTNLVITADLLNADARIDIQGGLDLTLTSAVQILKGLDFSVENTGSVSSLSATAFNGTCTYSGAGNVVVPPVMSGARIKLVQSDSDGVVNWSSGASFIAEFLKTNGGTDSYNGFLVEDVTGPMPDTAGQAIGVFNGIRIETGTGASGGANTVYPTTMRGMFIGKLAPNVSTGKVVDAYGIQINNQAASRITGNTSAIFLKGSGIGSDVAFGNNREARIHRTSAGGLNFVNESDNKFSFNVAADTDIVVDFVGTTNTGTLTYLEDEDTFKFDATVVAYNKVDVVKFAAMAA